MHNQNFNYSSLTDMLIKDGILSGQEDNKLELNKENIQNLKSEEDEEEKINSFFHPHSPLKNFFEEGYVEEIEENKPEQNRKRINQYDNDLLRNSKNQNSNTNPIKTVDRFINFKSKLANNNKLSLKENLLYRFFPKIYKSILIKEALNKLYSLNINQNSLKEKNIPYGEQETHYSDLIKYINFANEMQIDLKKKI